ncbi:MAG TPA: hypothetical protein VLC71_09530 [Thermomonas sp.]|nr:hypothetical protein [Thermomonas sp.]
MNKSMQIILGAALLALVAPVSAQVKPGPAPDRFDVADSNHDNRVDRGEYDGFVAELVLLYDGDRDGKLTRAETVDARDPSKFDRIDADRDGFLTHAEVAVFSDNDFGVMDANRDGAIDRDEAKRTR